MTLEFRVAKSPNIVAQLYPLSETQMTASGEQHPAVVQSSGNTHHHWQIDFPQHLLILYFGLLPELPLPCPCNMRSQMELIVIKQYGWRNRHPVA